MREPTDEVRAARELLAVLDATEAYLRVTGATHLSFASMLAVERAAFARAEELLEGLLRLDDLEVDDATDELLSGVVQPRPLDLVDAAREGTRSPLGRSRGEEPMDDGPEGSAADTNVLYSEEEEITNNSDEHAYAGEGGYADDGAYADDAAYADDEDRAAASAPGLVAFGDSESSYVSYDESADTGGYGYQDDDRGFVRYASDSDDQEGALPDTDQGAERWADRGTESEPTGSFEAADLAGVGADAYVSYDDEPDDTDEQPAPKPPGMELVGFDDDEGDEADTQVYAMNEEDYHELLGADEGAASRYDDAASAASGGEDLDLDEGDVELEELTLEDDDAPVVETFDLMPDDAPADDDDDDEVTSIHGAEALRRMSDEADLLDEPSDDEVVVPSVDVETPRPQARVGVGPKVAVAAPRVAPAPRVAAAPPTPRAAGAQVNAGLYGAPSAVPTIRDSNAPKPRAAAVQLNAAAPGTGKVLGLEEEEEPIAIGAVEDYDEELAEEYDDEPASGGFRLDVQEYEYREREEVEPEIEREPELPAPPPPRFVGPSAEQLRALFQQAQAAAEAGDMQRGSELYSDVIDMDPENIEAHVGRGRLFLDLGDYTRAMSDFMVSEDLAPGNPEPQIAIGDLYFARKDYRKAIDYFNAALTMSPDHAMAFCRRGISHYYRKNYKEGLDDLLRAQKLDPDIPNIGTYISMARKKAKK